MKTVLVTGATGFCGTHLVHRLVQAGYRVHGTELTRSSKARQGARLHPVNLEDRSQVFSLIRKLRPQWIFHLAAQSSPRQSWKSVEATRRINVDATIWLLDAVRRYRPECRVLLSSTSQVYGRLFGSRRKASESDRPLPVSPYACSKLLAELACLDYHARFQTDVVIARAFNHVGTGQRPEFVLADWASQIAHLERTGKPGSLGVGNIDIRRDFLSVADIVSAYILLMKKGKGGQIYNICSERPVKLRQILRLFIRMGKVPVRVRIEAGKIRRDDPECMTGSAAKIRRLGWRPRHAVGLAIEAMLEEWRHKCRAGGPRG